MKRALSQIAIAASIAVITILGGAAYLSSAPASIHSGPIPASTEMLKASTGQTPVSPSSTQPKISWSLPQVAQAGFPGTTSTITLTFQSDQSITSGVVVTLTPSLIGKVVASPSSFASIMAQRVYQVSVSFMLPDDFTRRAYSGTLQLDSQGGSHQTYAPPLPVNLQTVWNTVSPDGLFTINLPLDFLLTDVSTQNNYSTNVFELTLGNGDKVGDIWVYTSQQWAAAQQAEEYPHYLTESNGLVFAFGISQALPVGEQSARNEFLTAINSLRPR